MCWWFTINCLLLFYKVRYSCSDSVKKAKMNIFEVPLTTVHSALNRQKSLHIDWVFSNVISAAWSFCKTCNALQIGSEIVLYMHLYLRSLKFNRKAILDFKVICIGQITYQLVHTGTYSKEYGGFLLEHYLNIYKESSFLTLKLSVLVWTFYC